MMGPISQRVDTAPSRYQRWFSNRAFHILCGVGPICKFPVCYKLISLVCREMAVALRRKGQRAVPGTDPYLFATGHTHLPSGQWSRMPCGYCCFWYNLDEALTVIWESHGERAILFEFSFSLLVVDQGENFSLWLVCLWHWMLAGFPLLTSREQPQARSPARVQCLPEYNYIDLFPLYLLCGRLTFLEIDSDFLIKAEE